MPKRTPEKKTSAKKRAPATKARIKKAPATRARATTVKTAKSATRPQAKRASTTKPRGAPKRKKATTNATDGVILFVGPTMAASADARKLARGLRLRRPIRRHDVDDIVEARRKAKKKPGTLVIVDGLFHDTLAVGHAEIRDALAAGWRIWGLSSMGAIRAREMTHLGMRGYGRVFERFCEEGDFQDDEVALLHEPSAPYLAVSEPMVHLRAMIDHLVARNVLDADAGRAVVTDLKSRWYGERTLARLRHTVKRQPGVEAAAVDRELAGIERFRLKTLDLVSFLTERPFESGPA